MGAHGLRAPFARMWVFGDRSYGERIVAMLGSGDHGSVLVQVA